MVGSVMVRAVVDRTYGETYFCHERFTASNC